MKNISVWLAYVGLPYTTAAYYERALRRTCQTFTIGPKPTEELISKWSLESIRGRIKSHDLDTSYQPDMAAIYKQYSDVLRPSLYLWIESAGGYFPQNLDAIKCPKACIFIDSHVNLSYQLEWAKNFDFIFVAQLAYVQAFKNQGLNAYWLPLAADSEIHSSTEIPKIHDVSMVGSIFPNTRRFDLIKKIESKFKFYSERCFLEDMSRVYSASKIVFNNAIKDDLNMRIFEAMSTGSLLLTDMAKGSGQDELFKGDEDYVLYQDENILDRIQFYLDNKSKREEIALRGQNLIHRAHLYSHRVDDLLNVVLGKKADTFSALQLRELSLGNAPLSSSVEGSEERFSSQEVSYVIPVLDYSPASPFNIKTLLNDLADVPGDVIVVFNNEEVANELKHHPRINEYSILKHNVGVSRAWNIGLNISRTPYTFILNSDLKVSLRAISQLLCQIKTLDRAAIVGPQGAFFNFESMKDYYFFAKGSFNKPIQVDAVSGFFFVVNNNLFNENGLAFDNRYTPCYREEWDIGLQIKRANLRCYVAPVTDYDHQWSGSIRSYKKIRFYDQQQTPQEILERTGRDFQSKWQKIAQNQPIGFLDSDWKPFALKMIEQLISIGRQEQAQKVVDLLLTQFGGDKEVFASAGLVAYHANQWQQAKEHFSKALLIDSQYGVALKNLQIIYKRHEDIFLEKLRETKKHLRFSTEIINPFFEVDHEILVQSLSGLREEIDPLLLLGWLESAVESIATGVHNEKSYQLLRAISIHSGWTFNKLAKRLYKRLIPTKLPLSPKSVFIASGLEKDGFCLLEANQESIEFSLQTRNHLNNLQVVREKDGVVGDLKTFLRSPMPGAFRYFYLEKDLLVKPVLTLLEKMGIIRGIGEYLGHPILRSVNAWVSFPSEGHQLDDSLKAAQAYHFDNDNPTGWTKVFIYLSDVNEDTGPHVYVPGSHLHLPKTLCRDGRFGDDEVHNEYGPGLKITGKMGTVIVADTLGFHKGLLINSGSRIIFQVEFVNSLMGAETPTNENSQAIKSSFPDFMDERLSYRYARDIKKLNDFDKN